MPRGDKPTTVALALKDGWIYEDALPAAITKEQYDWWHKESLMLDGVRMGPSLLTDKQTDNQPPWKMKPLDEWSIVGMNHYHVNGEKRLFVAMTKGGHRIVEEGVDDQYLWNRLCRKAWGAGEGPSQTTAYWTIRRAGKRHYEDEAMTTDNQPALQPPDRVWLNGNYPCLYRIERSSEEDIEYVCVRSLKRKDDPSECFDRGYLGGSLEGHSDGYTQGYADAARVSDGGQLVDREAAAKIAFDTVMTALESMNHYSPLQVAAMAAANVRRLDGGSGIAVVNKTLKDCPNGCDQYRQKQDDSYCASCGEKLETHAATAPIAAPVEDSI